MDHGEPSFHLDQEDYRVGEDNSRIALFSILNDMNDADAEWLASLLYSSRAGKDRQKMNTQ